MSNAALSVKSLRKMYNGIPAVDGLDLEVAEGEVFGLLGHNGAGKSTAIECMLGIREPDAGTVTLLGLNPALDRKTLFAKVGVQFQDSHYPEKIKVGEMCELTHALYPDPADWQELLDVFGLAPMRNRLVSQLSGGERQKLSVLLSLMPNPRLVFLDELTTGLDPKARREIWSRLQALKSEGLTIVLTSHYMDEVETLCDRICLLKQGRPLITGTVQTVIGCSPYQELEEAYLWFMGEEGERHERVEDPA